MRVRSTLASLGAIGISCASTFAQTLLVGASIGGTYHRGGVNSSGVQTIVQLRPFVNLEGDALSATFGWSASPCPAAVKIKFFRPEERPISPGPTPTIDFLAERGPFDVTASPDPATPGFVTQTVSFDRPVHLRRGDVIAITNLTPYGGPVYVGDVSSTLPPPPPSSLIVAGDVTTFVLPDSARADRAVFVTATGPSPFLGLLGDRFQISLTARNPRNRATAAGLPNKLADGAGYFSLPDFTGDQQFPEVTVKMADATAIPSLGGRFWFFHAPLTDLDYVLTVTDQVRRVTRTS